MTSSGNVTIISGCCNIWTGPRHVRIANERTSRGEGEGEGVVCAPARPGNYGNKTKPKRVTGAASNGRQPGRIITRSSTLSTRFYPQHCWSTPATTERFLTQRERRDRTGPWHCRGRHGAYSRYHKNRTEAKCLWYGEPSAKTICVQRQVLILRVNTYTSWIDVENELIVSGLLNYKRRLAHDIIITVHQAILS